MTSFRFRTFLIFLCLSVPGIASAQIQNFNSLNGYAAGPENRLAPARDRALDELSHTVRRRATVGARYMDREVDPADERFQRETDGYGLRAGLFGGLKNWTVGLEVDYEDLAADYREQSPPGPVPNHGTVDTTGYQVVLNVLGDYRGWRLGVQGGYGEADHDATRRSDAGISSADYDSSEYFVLARLERDFAVYSEVTLTPFLAVSSSRVSTDGFRERGSSDSRVIEDFELEEELGIAGFRLSREWRGFSPALSVAWIRRFGDDSFDMTSSAPDGMDRWSGEIESPYSDLVAVGFSCRLDLSRNWWLRPEGRYLTGDEVTHWTLGVGLGRLF